MLRNPILRKNKTSLLMKYKTFHGIFNSVEDMAIFYKIPINKARVWAKRRKTADGWQIKLIYLPVDDTGNEIDVLGGEYGEGQEESD